MTATQVPPAAASTYSGPDRRMRRRLADRIWAPASVELTVVIPFLNPGAALRRNVLAVIDCLTAANVNFEVIAVCDGSTDGSASTITSLPHTTVLINRRNQGKGWALRQGFAAAAGAWIGFIDADGDIDPRHLVDYLHQIRESDRAGIYADKRHSRSASGATRSRKMLSLTYSTLVSSLFRLEVRDTQTGCKIFRRDVLQLVLPQLSQRGFACDLELFVSARKAGFTDFVGAPVRLETRVNGSTINGKAVLRTLGDTFAVFRRHRLSRSDGGPAPRAATCDLATSPTFWRRSGGLCPEAV